MKAAQHIERGKLQAHGGDRRPKQGGEQSNVSTLKPSEKNTAKHWMARLDRDRPDLAAKVDAGLMTANAAAVEAGFRKKPGQSASRKPSRKPRPALQRTLAKHQVLGPAHPGQRCMACGQLGDVKRIRYR